MATTIATPPFQQTIDLVEKLRAQNVAFDELIIPDEIHDLLHWSDWIRAYRATAESSTGIGFLRRTAISLLRAISHLADKTIMPTAVGDDLIELMLELSVKLTVDLCMPGRFE
jgi:hypothetical protein